MTRSTRAMETWWSSRIRSLLLASDVRSASRLASHPAMKLSDAMASRNNSSVSPSSSRIISDGSLEYFSQRLAIQDENGSGAPWIR